MYKLIVFIYYLSLASTVCQSQELFPRDTSYTLNSAWRKVSKSYANVNPAKSVVSNKYLTLKNQVYRIRSNRQLHMDIFIPSGKANTKRPIVLMIHGGGWRSGDKSLLAPLACQLANNNYVTACVEYRLSVEAKYPAAIYDLKEAIRFVKHNSDLYGIDTTQITVLGSSAGATLASLLATTNNLRSFDDPETVYPNSTSCVQALINIDGVVDFTDPNESGKDTDPDKPSAAAMFFGATYKENPKLWKEASPISYVDENTPPTLFLNSSVARFHAGRDSFLKILHKSNIYYRVHTIKNAPHTYWLFDPWFNETNDVILNFLFKFTIIEIG